MKTGSTRAAPSSAAFSTMKSVRAFLIGAKTSQRSGGRRCGRPGARQATAPPSRPVRVTGPSHSPSRPLKTATSAPCAARITLKR